MMLSGIFNWKISDLLSQRPQILSVRARILSLRNEILSLRRKMLSASKKGALERTPWKTLFVFIGAAAFAFVVDRFALLFDFTTAFLAFFFRAHSVRLHVFHRDLLQLG